jgi:ATP-dependent DNA helicase PIF1
MQLDDAQATENIFGGKTVVLGGDFRQILLIVPKGGQEDIVSASLLRSHLW